MLPAFFIGTSPQLSHAICCSGDQSVRGPLISCGLWNYFVVQVVKETGRAVGQAGWFSIPPRYRSGNRARKHSSTRSHERVSASSEAMRSRFSAHADVIPSLDNISRNVAPTVAAEKFFGYTTRA